MEIVSVIGCMYLCTSFKMMSFCDSLLGNLSTRMKTLILLVLALRIVPSVYAQEYCGYPEVYKLTKVTLDTAASAPHMVSDVIQNQSGVWTVGTISSSLTANDQNAVIVTRFNDTGKYEWHLRVDIAPEDLPRLASTDDQGVVVIGSTTSSGRTMPWIANISASGTLRWARRMDDIPGIPGSAHFYNVEVKSNGEIWVVGGGQINGITMPILLRINRFGNVINFQGFLEPVAPPPAFVTRLHHQKDIIAWGNGMLVAGEYQVVNPLNPTLNSGSQPVVSLFDSVGGFVKNLFFQSELVDYHYEVREVVRSVRHPERAFIVGSFSELPLGGSAKRKLWVSCIDVEKDSILWQNTYDTIESWGQRAYYDRDKLIVMYRLRRTNGTYMDGVLQLDTLGKWEFVHHIKVGDMGMPNYGDFYYVRNSFPLRDGGLVVVGNVAAGDTAHIALAWTKPCEASFCTNVGYAPTSFKPTGLVNRVTKGHSVVNTLTVSPLTLVQSQVPYVYQSMSCRYCPLPVINVSDVILCDFPLFHQQDVWDIYSKVTWNDGDNSKFKTFDRVGQYWLMKQNACGISRDTFRIFKENRPVKVLNDNEYFCRGRLFTLKATQPNPGNFTYRWSDGSTSPELNVYGTKTVTLTTNSNGCGSRTDVVNVYEVNCDCEICVPNSITPYNADGVNDEWLPRTDCKYDNCKIKEGSYRIYNRWGEKIAENPITVAWNGTDFKGDFVPRGVYVYNIKIIFDESVEGNRIINENGDITVW
jgi:hypothetical protein